MSTQKGKQKEKRGTKRGKICQMKDEKIKTINFYLQVLVLVIMKCKYNYINTKTHHFPLTFFQV